MYKTCPNCAYERQTLDTGPATECPACGVVFAKWLRHRLQADAPASFAAPEDDSHAGERWRLLKLRLFSCEEHVNPVVYGGRALMFLGLLIYGWQFLRMDYSVLTGGLPEINNSFMHRINLVFHEAGHVIFMPLGQFMMVLGGSLGQLIMPLIVVGVFLWKTRNPFGASVGLWWFAQSLMDLAPYINDARAGQLILLGGVTGRDRPGYHDWENILSSFGWMHHDHAIAGAVNGAGVVVMLVAFAWGGYLLYIQYRCLDRRF